MSDVDIYLYVAAMSDVDIYLYVLLNSANNILHHHSEFNENYQNKTLDVSASQCNVIILHKSRSFSYFS